MKEFLTKIVIIPKLKGVNITQILKDIINNDNSIPISIITDKNHHLFKNAYNNKPENITDIQCIIVSIEYLENFS